MAKAAGGRFGAWALAAVYGGLGAVVLAPIFAVRVPVLGDYLNHLAWIHVFTTMDGSPLLQKYYLAEWRLVPYFGMEMPVAGLARVMGLYEAGRVFVALCVVMPVVAAASLQYAVRGRVGGVPALGFLICYNHLLAFGFLTSLFGSCLAVMLFAAWIGCAGWRWWWRVALFGVAAPLLYMAHAFAFLTYGILVGGFEVARLVRLWGRPLRAAAADLLVAGAQVWPVLALTFVTRSEGMFGTAPVTQFGTGAERLVAFASPLYFSGTDRTLWVGVLASLGLFVLLVARVRLAASVWPSLLALSAVALCAPHVLVNVWGVDMRLPVALCMVLLGAAAPAASAGRGLAAAALAVVAVVMVVRAGDMFVLLRALDNQVAQVRQVVAALPVGARLLVVDDASAAPGRVAPPAMTGHDGMVAVVDRDAFVPFLFTGVTPLLLRPEMAQSASLAARAVTLAQLREGVGPAPDGPLPPFENGAQKYWLGWPGKFDYVLEMHFGARHNDMPALLEPVGHSKTADLYRIGAR